MGDHFTEEKLRKEKEKKKNEDSVGEKEVVKVEKEKDESDDELVKEIEDLDSDGEVKKDAISKKENIKGPSIDWGDSALAHLKDDNSKETPVDEKHAKNLKMSDDIIEELIKKKKKKKKEE